MKIMCLAIGGLLATGLPALAGADPLGDAARHLQEGNHPAAAERLRSAAPFAKEQIHERFLYATALAGMGEHARAEQIFKDLIADYPDRPEPYNNLAALYAAEGRLEQAREVLERAMRTDQRYAAIYGNLAAVYADMARASYAKALKLQEPDAPNLQMLHAVAEPGGGSTANTAIAGLPLPFEGQAGTWTSSPSLRAGPHGPTDSQPGPEVMDEPARVPPPVVPAPSSAAAGGGSLEPLVRR